MWTTQSSCVSIKKFLLSCATYIPKLRRILEFRAWREGTLLYKKCANMMRNRSKKNLRLYPKNSSKSIITKNHKNYRSLWNLNYGVTMTTRCHQILDIKISFPHSHQAETKLIKTIGSKTFFLTRKNRKRTAKIACIQQQKNQMTEV